MGVILRPCIPNGSTQISDVGTGEIRDAITEDRRIGIIGHDAAVSLSSLLPTLAKTEGGKFEVAIPSGILPVVKASHIVADLVGQGIGGRPNLVPDIHAKTRRFKAKARMSHGARQSSTVTVGREQSYQIGAILIPQGMDVVHKAVSFRPQTTEINGHLPGRRIDDLGDMDHAQLHRNQAVSIAKVGILNGAGDGRGNGIGITCLGSDCGRIDHQQVDEVGIAVAPTPYGLIRFARIGRKPFFMDTTSTAFGRRERFHGKTVGIPFETIAATSGKGNGTVVNPTYLCEGKEPLLGQETSRPGKGSFA